MVAHVGESNTSRKLYVDGANVATLTDDSTFGASINQLGIGAATDASPSSFLDGFVGEAIVTADIDQSQREQIEGHLAHKWGLAANLPSDHPYKSEAPMNSVAGSTANLSGTVSDADGDSVTSAWTVASQPAGSTCTITDPGALDTTATFDTVGTYTLRLTADDGFGPVYDEVTITVTDGSTTSLSITAASDAKTYDGTALTNTGYSISSGALLSGHTLDSVTVTGSRTLAGDSANVPSDALILDGSSNDVTGQYAITYESGTLSVTQRAITITAASDAKTYDGTALSNSGYGITSGTLATGDSLDSVAVTGSQTAAGSSANVPGAAVITDGASSDVTASYTITYENGSLTCHANSDGDVLPDAWEQQIIDADAGDGIVEVSGVDPFGDYDGDGLSNLLEYAFVLDPTDGSAANAAQIAVDEAAETQEFDLTVRLRSDDSNLNYVLQSSLDLSAEGWGTGTALSFDGVHSAWQSSDSNYGIVSQDEDPGNPGQWTLRIRVPSSFEKSFFRFGLE